MAVDISGLDYLVFKTLLVRYNWLIIVALYMFMYAVLCNKAERGKKCTFLPSVCSNPDILSKRS